MFKCRKSDIVAVAKEKKKCTIIDIVITGDNRVGVKELQKIQKYVKAGSQKSVVNEKRRCSTSGHWSTWSGQ